MANANSERAKTSATKANPNRQSVALLLIGILVAVVTAILGVFATIVYLSEKEQRWAELHNTLTTSLEQSSASLALPVWGLEDAQIRSIMNVTMTQREVFAITATLPNATYRLARDSNWRIVTAQSDPADLNLIAQERQIIYKENELGLIKIYVSPHFLNQELSVLRQNIFILILILDSALILSMAALLWQRTDGFEREQGRASGFLWLRHLVLR